MAHSAAQANQAISLIREAEERLQELAGYGPDWDSYGGDPPTALAIAAASSLVTRVVEAFYAPFGREVRAFAIAPTPDGGVLVEWRCPGHILSVLIGPDGSLGYMQGEGEPGARSYHEADGVSWGTVLELVGRILRHAAGA